MGYRDVSESLRAYRARIENELEEARRAAREADERAQKVKVLEKELAETESLIAKMGGKKRGLPMLDQLNVAAPCTASWEAMVGDDRVRFCGQCEKNVYNLSAMTRDEAEALLVAREGKMCVRFYRRADGTVMTEDCPVGVKRRRRRRAAFGTAAAGLMAAAAAIGTRATAQSYQGGVRPVAVMGTPPAEVGTAAPQTEPQVMGSAVVTPPPAPTTTTTAVQGHWMQGARPIPRPHQGKPTMGDVE